MHLPRKEGTTIKTKICKLCERDLPLSAFHVGTAKFKRDYRCKECKSANAADNYRANKFRYTIILKRSHCKKHGIPFDLDEEYLESIWTDTCPVLGTHLVQFDRKSDDNAQLDRIDPSRGYVKGNVVFISARANRIKTDGTFDEIRKVLTYLERCMERCNDYPFGE